MAGKDEIALLAAQMRSLAAVLPGVGHDLRGPINTMVFTLEVLRESAGRVVEPALRERQLGYVRVLADETRRLHRQVEILLGYAASPAGAREVVDLKPLALELADFLAGPLRKRRIELQRAIDEERLPVTGDRATLRQVLLHLGVAALAAASDHGTVTLAAGPRGDRAVVELGPAPPSGDEGDEQVDAARELLSTLGGTLVTVSGGPVAAPRKHRVELPLFREGKS